jgi:hypothetical protein
MYDDTALIVDSELWRRLSALIRYIRYSPKAAPNVDAGEQLHCVASFRLPVAVLKTVESSASPFRNLLNWDGIGTLKNSRASSITKKWGVVRTGTASDRQNRKHYKMLSP